MAFPSFPLAWYGWRIQFAEVNSGFHFGSIFESPTGQITFKGGHLRVADDVDLDPSLGCPVFSSLKVKQRSRSVLLYRSSNLQSNSFASLRTFPELA